MTRLVIVESPTKAKTIQGFLPKEYRVKACMGHIRDLPADAEEIPESVKGTPWARLGVNVRELKEALKDAEELIVATDEDREGESIGWHLTQVLKPKVPVRRMVFHEITREAIQDALQHYRDIDDKLVRAQETRRILDRLVGYTVSPLLWKKVAPGLSAGRVQSVAVRLLVNREENRRAFHQATFWDLLVELAPLTSDKKPDRFEATLVSVGGVRLATSKDFDESTGKLAEGKEVLVLNEAEADSLRERLRPAQWLVTDINEKEQIRRPAPPFTTSTLQQEANRKLRLSGREAMRIAQKLYEEGHITYMRTDSVHLSDEAITAARKTIQTRYGSNYLSPRPRQYTTKSKGAQEAHEAIRPAGNIMRTADELGLKGVEAALYEMIWKRTLASQMADARLTLIAVTIAAEDALFQANGRRIEFPGFFRVYVEGSDDPDAALDDRAVLLPVLAVNQLLRCLNLEPARHETQPPARFTEASLVQMLEREGVGRPSTYATIISTIQDRGYVLKVGNQLVPTFTALAVNRLLEQNFPSLVDTNFTARMEQTLDDIADGEAEWLPYLHDFYLGEHGLEAQVSEKTQTIDPRDIYALTLDDLAARVRIGRYGAYIERLVGDAAIRVTLPENLLPADLTEADAQRLLHEKEKGPNALGDDPTTGLPILLLSGRYGPYIQLGTTSDAGSGKPKRASLLKDMNPQEVTLDLALALLSLPRMLGHDSEAGEPIEAGMGPLGPFVRRGKDYRSLTADDDVLTIGLDRALELLRQPKARRGFARNTPQPLRELGKHPQDGAPVVVMNGRFGPYVKHGQINATLPRDITPESVTLDQALPLIAARAALAPTKSKKGTRTRTTRKLTSANGKRSTTKAGKTAKTTKTSQTAAKAVKAVKKVKSTRKSATAKTAAPKTSQTTSKPTAAAKPSQADEVKVKPKATRKPHATKPAATSATSATVEKGKMDES